MSLAILTVLTPYILNNNCIEEILMILKFREIPKKDENESSSMQSFDDASSVQTCSEVYIPKQLKAK